MKRNPTALVLGATGGIASAVADRLRRNALFREMLEMRYLWREPLAGLGGLNAPASAR